MKVSNILLKQHIGWHFTKLWNVQGKRKIIDSGLERSLKEKNICVQNLEEVVYTKIQPKRVEFVGYKIDEAQDEQHYKTVLSYKDNNVLLEGLNQAKLITNTVEIKAGIPEQLIEKEVKKGLNARLERMLLESLIFDAEQKKLPKVKDPERPSWNFPRTYAVTKEKISKNYICKLLHYIDMDSNKSMLQRNYILQDLYFKLPLQKYGLTIQLELKAESMIFSQKSLPPVTRESAANVSLPDMSPLQPVVSLNKEKVKDINTFYPFKSNALKLYPHTIFVFYNPEEVKNLFEKEVTEDQIFGRSLLKAYTVAGTFARQEFGEDVSELPNPITVQCIQTDGKFFHFGILQLNNLNTNEDTQKNIWYQTPLMTFYENCSYVSGQPVVKNYNPDIVKYLYNFCNNH